MSNPTGEISSVRRVTQALARSSGGSVGQSYSYDTNDEDRSKANTLWEIIDDEDWEAVIEHISDFPQLARSRNRVPNSIQFNLPLHEVCRRQPPLQVVNLLLAFYDEAVHTPGQYGFLPLHVACGTGASCEVVTRLIDAYPAATRCRDDVKDALPLHLAAQWGASEEVLMEILTTHPEGSVIRDASGKTPLDHAKTLPEGQVKEYAISALETAPILVATAKSAARRVEREMESRIKGVQDAHQEFIRQMEQRHDDENTEFLHLEVRFHNELAAEKERNCELAEVILRLQKREWKESEERDVLQKRLEEQEAEFGTRWEKQQKDLKAILERVVDDSSSNTDSKRQDRASAQLKGGDEKKDEDEDEDAEEDGSPAIQQTYSSSSELSDVASSSNLLNQISQVVSRYAETEGRLRKTTDDLRSREATVQHLDDLVKKKEQEIQSLKSQLQEAVSKNQVANDDLRKMGTLHKEAVQELYSLKNEMNRLKRRSENQQQQLQETRRKLEVREKRMEKVKGLVASLSLNVDRWDLDPEESQIESLHDDSLPQEEEKLFVQTNSSMNTKEETVPPEIDENIVDGMEKIQNISNISMDQSDSFPWRHDESQRHAVPVSDGEGGDGGKEGLEAPVANAGGIVDKFSEDSNETAATTKVAETDDELEENLSLVSQHSASPQGIESIRPIDSDLI